MATSASDAAAIRAAALAWLNDVTLGGTVPATREQLANDFHVARQRFPLVDRGRGIRKPEGWSAALSILTAHGRPYDDEEGADGLHRYKLRRDQRGSAENQSLRAALRDQVPLIWFYGIAPGVFNAIFPVWLIAEEAELDQFVLALTEAQRSVRPNDAVEETFRRYLIAETKRRLHQPVFAGQAVIAYETRCAVCRIGHCELLDAARRPSRQASHAGAGAPIRSSRSGPTDGALRAVPRCLRTRTSIGSPSASSTSDLAPCNGRPSERPVGRGSAGL